MTRQEQITKWWEKGWGLKRIGKKYNLTKQRISQILGNQTPDFFKRRNKYYCRSCEQFFWSKLGVKDAICTKCGKAKIVVL